MENDDNKEQQRQVGIYTSLGNLDRGALAHAFMTVNSQNEEENNSKIIDITSRQPSKVSSDPAFQQTEQIAEERQDPSTALRDLRLPDNLFKFLWGILKSQGFGEIYHEKRESFAGKCHYRSRIAQVLL